MDIQPSLQGFQSVNKYLNDLWIDVNNPAYFQQLFLSFGSVLIDPIINDSHIETFIKSPTCNQCPFACQAKVKFECFKWEIRYMMKVFHATHKKFLTARDHIDYHPTRIQNDTKGAKRSVLFDMHGLYHTPTKILTPYKENFLDAFMKTLYQINSSLHNKLSCIKRVVIFTWVLGWGVFSNARNIAKIKDNLHTLHQQNQRQNKQIKQLAKYLNLTIHQVYKHSEMLYELDTKMLIINKTLQQIMYTLDIMQYESNLLHYFQNRIYRIYTSLYALKGDTESLFKYMRALASQELNQMIIPPDILKTILHKIETDIKSHARFNYVKTLTLIYGLTTGQ